MLELLREHEHGSEQLRRVLQHLPARTSHVRRRQVRVVGDKHLDPMRRCKLASYSLVVGATMLLAVACGEPARITGRVVDNFGAPVESATVRVQDSAFLTTTNSTGEFSLEYAPGSFTIVIEGPVVETTRDLNIAQLVPYPLGQVDVVRLPAGAGVHIAGPHAYVTLEPITTRREIAGIGTHRFNLSDPPREVSAAITTLPESAAPPTIEATGGLVAFADETVEGEWLLVALNAAFLTVHCSAAPVPRMPAEGVRCPFDARWHSAPLVDMERTDGMVGNRVLIRASGLVSGAPYCLVRGRTSDQTRRRLWRYNTRFAMDYEPGGFLGELRGSTAWCFLWGHRTPGAEE